MTKIDIISGFLGAGKTTLIKKLLSEALTNEKVVLIENEFGEIGIDGGFLQDAGVQVTEMNAGCICCSLVGDFGKALREVLTQFAPDRIVIEPSGVGKLSDVIGAVRGVAAEIALTMGSFVSVVDATKCKMYSRNFGEFYGNQIENSGAIVLSRTQGMRQDKLDEVCALLRAQNRDARIVTTPWDTLTGAQLLDAMEHPDLLAAELLAEAACPVCGHHHAHEHEHAHEHGCDCGHDHAHEHHEHGCVCGQDHDHEHDHHEHAHAHGCDCGHDHHAAEEVFTAWGAETAHHFTEEGLRTALQGLADETVRGTVLRAKGIVPCGGGGWLHFDYVPGAVDVRSGSASYTGRLCVIGAGICDEQLQALFGLA